jgi:hypothetical protein
VPSVFSLAGDSQILHCRIPHVVSAVCPRLRIVRAHQPLRNAKCLLMGRCATFVGLLIGCYEVEDGSLILASNPSLNCDEIPARRLTGIALTAVYVAGLPLLLFLFAAKYHCSSFKSALSTFLVRSIFAGHRPTFAAMCYRILTLLRCLGFVVITQAQLTGQTQAVASLLLVTLTLVIESVVEPRTSRMMSLFDRLEEVVLFVVICLGILGSGASRPRRSCAFQTTPKVWAQTKQQIKMGFLRPRVLC